MAYRFGLDGGSESQVSVYGVSQGRGMVARLEKQDFDGIGIQVTYEPENRWLDMG